MFLQFDLLMKNCHQELVQERIPVVAVGPVLVEHAPVALVDHTDRVVVDGALLVEYPVETPVKVVVDNSHKLSHWKPTIV